MILTDVFHETDYCLYSARLYGLRLHWNSQVALVVKNMPANAAAAAAKSLQSYPTLCDPIDGSPPGSTVPGILQARTLEWVAVSFSNAWRWKVKVKSLSRVQPSATPWTAAFQAPLSMGFSRQEYWVGVPLLSQPANAGNTKEMQFISWVGKIPSKEGNGYPLLYSCQENPRDREAWLATVHSTKSQTQLKQLGTHAACVDYVFSQDLWGKKKKRNEERKGEMEAGIGGGTNKLVVLSSSYLIR